MTFINGAIAIRNGTLCGNGFGGWRVAEDEEFDKGTDEDHDGKLAEKKPFGEG